MKIIIKVKKNEKIFQNENYILNSFLLFKIINFNKILIISNWYILHKDLRYIK